MDLRAQKRRSFLSQPQGASTVSLQRSLTQHSGKAPSVTSPSVASPSVTSPSRSTNLHNTSFSSPSSKLERTKPRPTKELKLVCVGDGGCGKTSLLTRYVKGDYSNTYVPTVFDNEIVNVQYGGYDISLALWDTAGQEEYDRLRALSYPESDVLLLCYSLDSPASLENITDKWLPEVRLYCPGIPFLLVGLKSDCRQDGAAVLSWKDGQQVAEEEKLAAFLECSALLNYNIATVFEVALSTVLPKPQSAKTGPPIAPINPSPKPPQESLSPTKPVVTPQKPRVRAEDKTEPETKRKRKRERFHCTVS